MCVRKNWLLPNLMSFWPAQLRLLLQYSAQVGRYRLYSWRFLTRLARNLVANGCGVISGVLSFEDTITGKWLAMLKEIAPHLEARCTCSQSQDESL